MNEEKSTLIKKERVTVNRDINGAKTELERLESLIDHDELIGPFGDLDTYENVLLEIESDLDDILEKIKNLPKNSDEQNMIRGERPIVRRTLIPNKRS